MAAYAVTAHIGRARPHRPGRAWSLDAAVTLVADRRPAREPEDVTVAPLEIAEADARPSAASTWAETTFFLFDPESWR